MPYRKKQFHPPPMLLHASGRASWDNDYFYPGKYGSREAGQEYIRLLPTRRWR